MATVKSSLPPGIKSSRICTYELGHEDDSERVSYTPVYGNWAGMKVPNVRIADNKSVVNPVLCQNRDALDLLSGSGRDLDLAFQWGEIFTERCVRACA